MQVLSTGLAPTIHKGHKLALISLYNEEPKEPLIDLYGSESLSLPPDVVEQRAAKASIGTGLDQKTLEVNISSGNEDRMRQLAARNREAEVRRQKAQMIDDIMEQNQGKVSDDMVQFMMGLTEEHLENPDTIFESEYAKKYFQQALTLSEDGALKDALDEDPDSTFDLMERGEQMLVRKEVAQKKLEELEAKYSEKGLLGKTWENLETFIPLKSAINISNAIQNSEVAVSWLPGNNRKEQIDYLLLLPPGEFQKQFTQAVDSIASSNMIDAMQFASAVLSYSSSEEAWDNAMGIADVADIATMGIVTKAARGVAKGAARGARKAVERESLGRLRSTLRDAFTAGVRRNTDPAEVAAATGDFEKAAEISVIKRHIQRLRGQDKLNKGRTLFNQVPSILDPQSLLTGKSKLAKEYVQRIGRNLEDNSTKLISAIADGNRINRLVDDALQAGVQAAKERVAKEYVHLQDSVLDIAYEFEPLANTHSVNVQLGKTNGLAFDSREQAALIGKETYKLPSKSFTVQPVGDKFVINISKPVNETDPVVRDLIDTDNKSQRSWANTLTGWLSLRTPNDVLSPIHSANRVATGHAQQRLLKLFGEVAENISGLSNSSKKKLERVLKKNRDDHRLEEDASGNIKERRGRWSSTIGEFESDFYDLNGEWPTEKEVQAYFSYRQINDASYMVMNLGVYRDKVRQGIENFSFFYKNVDSEGNVVRDKSRYFEGRIVDEIPWEAAEDVGVGVYNHESGKTSYVRTKNPSQETKDYIDNLLSTGNYKIIQIANPLQNPVAEATGTVDTINFFLVRDFETKALDFKQIPYNPGGPVVYADEWFVKQPRMRDSSYGTKVYEGDVSMIAASSEAEAKKWAKAMDEARKMLKAEKNPPEVIEGVSFNREALAREFNDAQIELDAIDDEIAWLKEEISWRKKEMFNSAWLNEVEAEPIDVDDVPYYPDYIDPDDIRKQTQFEIKDLERQIKRKETERTRQIEAIKSIGKPRKTKLQTLNPDDYIRANLPWSPKEFRRFFEPELDKDGAVKQPAKLSLDHPIRVTRSGNGVNDVARDELRKQYPNFEDVWDSHYNLYRDINKAHTGERDFNLPGVTDNLGTEANPLYNLKEPRLIDPLAAMNNMAASFIRSRVMADYDYFAIESFIKDFGHLMDAPRGLDEIRENPVRWLHEPKWKNNVDFSELSVAKATRSAIIHLLGSPSDAGKMVDKVKHDITSFIFDKAGKKWGDWTADRMLHTVAHDPFKWMRNVAFHSKLGLFNPVQLFLQLQSLTHISAIAPQHVSQAWFASFFQRRMMTWGDEALEDAFSNMATPWGWSKQDFLESYRELKKTGLWHVEGEVAWRDDMFEPKMVQTKLGKVLDWGTFFFKEAERNVRLTAWNVAYREWKKANPGKLVNDKARQQILARQNLLAVNMTRDANAGWQQGLMSIPTQFFAYQVRLMEQMLGKRLTTAEKTRAILLYSAMYGIPTGATVLGGVGGAAIGGTAAGIVSGGDLGEIGKGAVQGAAGGMYVFRDELRKLALEYGWNVDEKTFELLFDGIPSVAIEYLTGTDINFSERYGPNGLSFLKDATSGGESALQVVLGASGSIMKDMVTAIEPVTKWAFDVFSEGETYKITPEDFVDAASEISTVNNASKMIYALNYGKYVTRNEILIDNEINSWDAIFMGITGLTPQEVSDTFLMIESNRENRDVQNEAKKLAIKYIRRGLEAESQDDMEAYMMRAKIHLIGGGFRPDQYGDVLSEALNGQDALVDKIRKEFFIDKAPVDQRDLRMQEFERQLQAQ